MADEHTRNQDPAEGRRDTVDDTEARQRYEDAEDQSSEGGGITNRPLEEEKQNQRDLPPRGTAKPGGHAS